MTKIYPWRLSLHSNGRGFNAVRERPGMADPEIASQAKRERRIILTFDSDFSNILAYPPRDSFDIIRIKISPPLISLIIKLLKNLLDQFKTLKEFWGKLIIVEPAKFRIWEG